MLSSRGLHWTKSILVGKASEPSAWLHLCITILNYNQSDSMSWINWRFLKTFQSFWVSFSLLSASRLLTFLFGAFSALFHSLSSPFLLFMVYLDALNLQWCSAFLTCIGSACHNADIWYRCIVLIGQWEEALSYLAWSSTVATSRDLLPRLSGFVPNVCLRDCATIREKVYGPSHNVSVKETAVYECTVERPCKDRPSPLLSTHVLIVSVDAIWLWDPTQSQGG